MGKPCTGGPESERSYRWTPRLGIHKALFSKKLHRCRRVERVKKWEQVVTRICYAEMSFVRKESVSPVRAARSRSGRTAGRPGLASSKLFSRRSYTAAVAVRRYAFSPAFQGRVRV